MQLDPEAAAEQPTGASEECQRRANASWQEYRRGPEAMSGDALARLPEHLIGAERWEDVGELLCDIFYLEAVVSAGRAGALVAEFRRGVAAMPADLPQRRILRLLNEALQRDIDFIARHAEDYPQALFQCLWNTCWWYDCPDAAEYYVEGLAPSERGGQRGPSHVYGTKGACSGKSHDVPRELGRSPASDGPDSQERVPTLHRILERWREAKEQTTPGFLWLASLRPPLTHLGGRQAAVFRGHEDSVKSVSFAPDGRRIASSSSDGTVRIWDTKDYTGLAVLRGHARCVTSVAWCPEGTRIASSSHDATIAIWDVQHGKQLAVLRNPRGGVNSVSWSSDGKRIAAGSQYVAVWVLDECGQAKRTMLRGWGWVRKLAYSPDGSWFASVDDTKKRVRVWDAHTGAELRLSPGSGFPAESLSWSPDGTSIASILQGKVRVWDASTGAELATFDRPIPATDVSYSPDGSRIAVTSQDNTIRLLDAQSGAELAVLRGHERAITSVSWSPDGMRLASGSDDRTVRIWNVCDVADELTLRGHFSAKLVQRALFSPDGEHIVSANCPHPHVSSDDTAQLFDAHTGLHVTALPGGESFMKSLGYFTDALSICYSHCGSCLATSSDDAIIRIWDPQDGTELTRRQWCRGFLCMNYSPEGLRIVSGSYDKQVRIWDAFRLEELAAWHAHDDLIASVCYSPDGARIASASEDRTVRVWDLRSDAQLLSLKVPDSCVWPRVSVCFSPDGLPAHKHRYAE